MASEYIADVVRVAVLVIGGIVMLSYVLYRVYGNNLVIKMWIRIIPTIAFAIINATIMQATGWTRNWLILGMDGSILIAITLTSLITTGRYFEKNIERGVIGVKIATKEVSTLSDNLADASLQLAQSASESGKFY